MCSQLRAVNQQTQHSKTQYNYSDYDTDMMLSDYMYNIVVQQWLQ